MMSDGIPPTELGFAELFFGKGKAPTNKTEIRGWIVAHDHPTTQVKGSSIRRSTVYTGTEPDSWHLTEWEGLFYLVYISDDNRLYSLGFLPGGLGFQTYNADTKKFNGGRGWACQVIYDVSNIIKKLGFINWLGDDPFRSDKQ